MSDTIHLPLTVATRLCAELDADANADTPESNAAERMAYSGEYMVPTQVLRRLERERDKAREDATNYYAKICELREDLEVLRSNKMGDPLLEITFRNLISERDELKYKIKELDQALKASAELLCFFFQQSGITKEDLKERLEAAK